MSVQLVNDWRNGIYPAGSSIDFSVNPGLIGKNSLEVFDIMINHCRSIGLKIMFDMHRVIDSNMTNLWYAGYYTETDFKECWRWLAARYKGDDTILVADLFNEPHGNYPEQGSAAAKWDLSPDPNNWKRAVEETAGIIFSENPQMLILIEGIEVCFYQHPYHISISSCVCL